MLNEKLITDAVKIVIEYFEAEHIQESTATIRERAVDWYNHTDITEPYLLAAVTMSGPFDKNITYLEIENIKEFYFPTEDIFNLTNNYFSIEEIEMSLFDMFR